MAEYIERKAAINRIKEYASDVYGIDLDDANQFSGDSLSENYCEGLYEATELIDDMPAADVAPVTHGEWIEDDYGYNRCSVCGWEWDEPEAASLYCPHCGAKMEEGEIDA